jgi:putative endonuclease
MKKNTKTIGDRGEDKAVLELQKMGYKVVARNWRNRFGEVDVIAHDGDVLVFVEVKAKKNDFFGAPAEMITGRKLQKIIRTAENYVAETGYEGPWRIDAVLIEGEEIEVLKNISI